MNEIVEKVRAFAQENELFAPGQRLCAAVSGGADSMALLRLLLRIQPVFGYELTACHVNHGLRGEPADRDEAFVRAECARLNVPLRVFHPADVGAAVPAHPGEDWARKLRYACFDALRAGGIDAVATAHTATDQTETLLFRLARGAGLHGAAGIRPSRPGFCRPLLCLTRAETEQVCTACGQRWVTDETNASDAYARNRLRHAALPALRSVNEAAEENFARFCEKAARADAYFAQRAEELLEDAEVLLPPALPAGARYALQSGRPVWGLEGLQEADPLILEAALHSLVAPVRDAEEKYIRLLADEGNCIVQILKIYQKENGTDDFTEQVMQLAAEVGGHFPDYLKSPEDYYEHLTNMEQKVLCLMAQGLSNDEIADRLGKKTGTVKFHSNNIFRKLEVQNRHQAVSRGREVGLI